MIIINKPYVSKDSVDKGWVKLCSDIQLDNDTTTVWYEVEEEYSNYLCYEKADAFLAGILPLAMAFKHDIIVKGAPVSEKLYWSLSNLLIPCLDKYSNYYQKIHIEAELTDITYDSFAVGTGFSAGVDSFFTLLKNYNMPTSSFNITHLTFFNVGANGSYGGAKSEERFAERIKTYEPYIKKLGVGFIKINSNISEFVMMSYNYTHSFRSLSAVLAMQKMFKTYYYSAGFTLDEFCMNPADSAYYDLMNVQALSNESVTFYTTGTVETRLDKVKYISQFSDTYSLLNVCNEHDYNCRTCEKCIRTMTELYSIGQLEKYSEVFDVDYFYNHLGRNLAFCLAKQHDGSVEGQFSSKQFMR